MRNLITAVLLTVLVLPFAACVSAGLSEDGSAAQISVSPLVGLDRLQKSEEAVREWVGTLSDQMKEFVSEESKRLIVQAEADFQAKVAALMAEDNANSNLLLYGMGLLGLGGLAETGRRKVKSVRAKSAEAAASQKAAEQAALVKAVAAEVSKPVVGPVSA